MPAAAAARKESRTARVLVIEDDPELETLTRMILEMAGHEIESVRTGEDAIDALEASIPDVVLLDIRLPGISGWDVLDHLAQRSMAVRVIPVSAHTSPASLERALRMGCVSYVTKP